MRIQHLLPSNTPSGDDPGSGENTDPDNTGGGDDTVEYDEATGLPIDTDGIITYTNIVEATSKYFLTAEDHDEEENRLAILFIKVTEAPKSFSLVGLKLTNDDDGTVTSEKVPGTFGIVYKDGGNSAEDDARPYVYILETDLPSYFVGNELGYTIDTTITLEDADGNVVATLTKQA